jgi:hypothetical protein
MEMRRAVIDRIRSEAAAREPVSVEARIDAWSADWYRKVD